MHDIRYEKVHVLLHSDTFASLCCEVIVTQKRPKSGHPVGDQVLIAIAYLLKSTFPADAPAGRLGRGKYCIFFPGPCSFSIPADTLKYLSYKIKALRFCDAEGLQVSCSFGVARCCPSDDFDNCHRRADSALYDAKKSGKDLISFSG